VRLLSKEMRKKLERCEVEVGFYNDLCLSHLCHNFGAERKAFLIASTSAFICSKGTAKHAVQSVNLALPPNHTTDNE